MTPPRDPAALPAPGELTVRIDFHGPFRVGTGTPEPGAHQTVRDDDPVPAPTIKGLMRAAARQLLPGGPGADRLLGEIFGTERIRTPWHWTGADFGDTPPLVTVRARIAIEEATGTVKDNHLLFAEENWARTAQFTVTRTAYLAPDVARDHLAVLACAAAGVHGLGGDRRRGLGWVTCTPEGPGLSDELLDRFEALRSRCTPPADGPGIGPTPGPDLQPDLPPEPNPQPEPGSRPHHA